MVIFPAQSVRQHTQRSRPISPRLRYGLIIAAMVPALLLALVALRNATPVAAFRDLVFDTYLRAKPRPYRPDLPVRVIDIDDESLKRHGQWPWPRPVLAHLTTRLQEAGAAAIAFDILMAEPDRYAPEQLAARLPPSPERDALEAIARKTGNTNDAIFAQSIAGESVVIALAGTNSSTNKSPAKHGFAFAGDPPHDFLPRMSGAVLPLPAFSDAAAGVAALNFFPDRDLVVRRVPTLMTIGGAPVPGLALEALRIAQRASTFVVKSSNASGELAFGAKTGLISIKVGALEIATESDGALRVYYAGTQPQRRVPAWRILAGNDHDDALRGAILFVGSSAAGMDIRATPLDGALPGVDVHAEMAEHILSGAQLVRPDYARGLEAFIIIAAGMAAAVLVLTLPAASGALVATLLTAAIGLASWFSFTHAGLLFDPVLPSVSLLAGFGAATVIAYRRTERDRARIRDAFGRYVSPAVIETLAADPSRLKLGGENRDVTVLFTDIRNFTARAEKLPAEQVVQFLNAVHTPLTEAVMKRNGTIDKYIGDGMMAFWNAPLDDADHVRNALRAALDMVAMIPQIDAALRIDEIKEPLRVGIGIHTGTACVGNLGSNVRFDYSIVGDTVNSAARLEPLSKTYGVAIVVADAIVQAVPEFAYVPLDAIQLRGRESAMGIFALLGDETVARHPDFRNFLEAHNAMRAALADNNHADESLLRARACGPYSAQFREYYEGLRLGHKVHRHPA